MVKLLLVDDEKDILLTVKTGLERRGFQVDTYHSSEEALLKFTPNTYDLIILDVRMPKMNGYQLYDEIKKKDPKAKIHFISAFEFFENAPKHIVSDLTGENFLQKPITISEMIKTIILHTKK